MSFFLLKKEKLDSNNPRVREWENLMGKFKKSLPFFRSGFKMGFDGKNI